MVRYDGAPRRGCGAYNGAFAPDWGTTVEGCALDGGYLEYRDDGL
jgi:hypothetical protein